MMMMMMMITTPQWWRGSVTAFISLLVFIKIFPFSIEVPSIQLIDSARVLADVHARERDEKRRVFLFSCHTRRPRKSCRRRLCFLLVLRVVFSSLLSSRIFSAFLGKGRSFCLCPSSMSAYFEATITSTDREWWWCLMLLRKRVLFLILGGGFYRNNRDICAWVNKVFFFVMRVFLARGKNMLKICYENLIDPQHLCGGFSSLN